MLPYYCPFVGGIHGPRFTSLAPVCWELSGTVLTPKVGMFAQQYLLSNVLLATQHYSIDRRSLVRDLYPRQGSRWRHQMATFSAWLSLLCGEFTGHRWIPLTNGQWRGVFMFSLNCAWTNDWANSRDAIAHYVVTLTFKCRSRIYRRAETFSLPYDCRFQWFHDDVIKWKHFPRYWPFGRGIYPRKGQWRRALVFSLICAGINGWVNNR